MTQDVVYDVVNADSIKNLTRDVNAALLAGWELVGGVSCAISRDQGYTEYLFTQAMIRPRTNPIERKHF